MWPICLSSLCWQQELFKVLKVVNVCSNQTSFHHSSKLLLLHLNCFSEHLKSHSALRWKHTAKSRDLVQAGSRSFVWMLPTLSFFHDYEIRKFTQMCDPVHVAKDVTGEVVILTKPRPFLFCKLNIKFWCQRTVCVRVGGEGGNWKCLFWSTHDNNIISLSGCLDWAVIKA